MVYQPQANFSMQHPKDLSSLKTLLLVNAIFCTILGVPGLGWLLSLLFQIPMIPSLVIAIICIVKARRINQSITGSVFVIIATICSFMSGFLLLASSISSDSGFFSFAYLIVGVIALILYIVAAVFLFIDYSNTSKALRPLSPQTVNHTSPNPQAFGQTTMPTPKQMAHTSNPFASQTANEQQSAFTPSPQSQTTHTPNLFSSPPTNEQQSPFTPNPQNQTAHTPNPFIESE